MRSWGGAEVWILDTAVALAGRGHRVSIVAQPGSELLRRCRAAGVEVFSVPIRCDGAPWTLAKLALVFRREGVTAIVANLTKDLKAAAVAGRLAGVPLILATRESDFPLKDKRYYRWYFTRAATGMLVNSEATRHTVLTSAPWLDPARVHLLYKGIDTGRFQPADRAAAQPVVGFLGQFIERKGLQELMEAWQSIEAIDRPQPPQLRFAGAGTLAAELAAWRTTLRHPQQVEIVGFVEDPAAFLRGLSLLAMPSHAEGFGLAAAEAGACGLPVVAADASSLPEIVVHEETGLLVPPGDSAALAAAIGGLLTDPERATKLGAAARVRVVARFDRERSLDRLLNLTGATMASHQGDRPCPA